MTTAAYNPCPFHPYEATSHQQMLWLWQRVGYAPQPYQEFFHQQVWWNKCAISGGTGAAKSYTTAMQMLREIVYAVFFRRMYGNDDGQGFYGRVGIIGPNYKPTQAIFNYVQKALETLGLVKSVHRGEANRSWYLETVHGCRVETLTATDEEKIATFPYTMMVATEAMKLHDGVLTTMIERLSRWPGRWMGKLIMEGTWEKKTPTLWFIDTCRRWSLVNEENAKFFRFASWWNKYNYPDGLQDPKIVDEYTHHKAQGTLEQFWVRKGGKIPEIQGALWADLFRGAGHNAHIQELPYNPELPLYVGVDPGTHRYAIVFAQEPRPGVVHVVGEIVLTNTHIGAVLEEWLDHPCIKHRITTRTVALANGTTMEIPHRISGIRLAAIDNAASQHHQGMSSTIEKWNAAIDEGGFGCVQFAKQYLLAETHLEVMQTALEGIQYQFAIDSACAGLIFDLTHEQRDKTGTVTERVNRGKDDARKALTYLLAVWKGVTSAKDTPRQPYQARGTASGMEFDVDDYYAGAPAYTMAEAA